MLHFFLHCDPVGKKVYELCQQGLTFKFYLQVCPLAHSFIPVKPFVRCTLYRKTVHVHTACRVCVPHLRETHGTMREWERNTPYPRKKYFKKNI